MRRLQQTANRRALTSRSICTSSIASSMTTRQRSKCLLSNRPTPCLLSRQEPKQIVEPVAAKRESAHAAEPESKVSAKRPPAESEAPAISAHDIIALLTQPIPDCACEPEASARRDLPLLSRRRPRPFRLQPHRACKRRQRPRASTARHLFRRPPRPSPRLVLRQRRLPRSKTRFRRSPRSPQPHRRSPCQSRSRLRRSLLRRCLRRPGPKPTHLSARLPPASSRSSS